MKKLLSIVVVLVFSVSSFAAVTAIQDGTAVWPTAPTVQAATPTMTSLVAEQAVSGTPLSQTFVAPISGNLSKVFVFIGGNGASVGDWGMRLVDLGVQSTDPASYAAGTNLFSTAPAPLTWWFNGWPDPHRVVELDFTGADAVALIATHMYAFELLASPTASGGNLYWDRVGGSSQPSGGNPLIPGDGYKGRSKISGMDRDLVFAVVIPEPATMALLCIGGLLLRRKK